LFDDWECVESFFRRLLGASIYLAFYLIDGSLSYATGEKGQMDGRKYRQWLVHSREITWQVWLRFHLPRPSHDRLYRSQRNDEFFALYAPIRSPIPLAGPLELFRQLSQCSIAVTWGRSGQVRYHQGGNAKFPVFASVSEA
jgi:hypothetical protein